MRILIVKLTSMGDLIQVLPAISTLHRRYPHVQTDWVVDESFAEVPLWHPAVHAVIISAHRRWSRSLHTRQTWGELATFWCRLRRKNYDYVIDMQGNIKSALVTRLARGFRCGPQRGDTSESLVHLMYQKKLRAPLAMHSVRRWMHMISDFLAFVSPSSIIANDTRPDFSIAHNWNATQWQTLAKQLALPNTYWIVFVTNASWDTKHVAKEHWISLATYADQTGFGVLLPWGNQAERDRAKTIAQACSNAVVLPKLSLGEIATICHASCGAICNDTGLAHLAAALHVPTVCVYGPTDEKRIGIVGKKVAHLHTDVSYPCRPCYKRLCTVNMQSRAHTANVGYSPTTDVATQAACLRHISPQSIWQAFMRLQNVP